MAGDARPASSPLGLHRVVEPAGVLPQAAWRLDASAALWPDEVRLRLEWLELDAASFRQLARSGDGDAVRRALLAIVEARGKVHNPATGSGGMLVGVVDEVGPDSPLGLHVGQRVATLVSLTLTPVALTDGLARWDGCGPQVPAAGHAVLFARSLACPLPADLPVRLALAVLDVCGAPALTARVLGSYPSAAVTVIGAGGKSGSLSMAAARRAGARHVLGVVPGEQEAAAVRASGLADDVAVLDARDPVAVMERARPADLTVVCVDVPGCEHAAILATAPRGTVLFFSMATSFTAAALGAEGLGCDVTLLIGNGYVPGHAALALDLVRREPGVRRLLEARLSAEATTGPVSPGQA